MCLQLCLHECMTAHDVLVPHRRVSMLPDVHLGKGAGVPHPDHLHRKVPEEINDLQRLSPQTEDQDDGSHHWTEQLLENKDLDAKQMDNIDVTVRYWDEKHFTKTNLNIWF